MHQPTLRKARISNTWRRRDKLRLPVPGYQACQIHGSQRTHNQNSLTAHTPSLLLPLFRCPRCHSHQDHLPLPGTIRISHYWATHHLRPYCIGCLPRYTTVHHPTLSYLGTDTLPPSSSSVAPPSSWTGLRTRMIRRPANTIVNFPTGRTTEQRVANVHLIAVRCWSIPKSPASLLLQPLTQPRNFFCPCVSFGCAFAVCTSVHTPHNTTTSSPPPPGWYPFRIFRTVSGC